MNDRPCEIILFPMSRHAAWRVVEATALRKAGGANAATAAAVNHLAMRWTNVPLEILRPELDRVRDHIARRVEDLRAAVGTGPFEYRDRPAEVVPIRGAPQVA